MPDTSWDDRDDCDDEDIHDEIEARDAERERWTCVLGERCLVADPFHMADECFDAEWAERYFAEAGGDPRERDDLN